MDTPWSTPITPRRCMHPYYGDPQVARMLETSPMARFGAMGFRFLSRSTRRPEARLDDEGRPRIVHLRLVRDALKRRAGARPAFYVPHRHALKSWYGWEGLVMPEIVRPIKVGWV